MKKTFKRLTACFLAVLMVFTAMPYSVFAESGEPAVYEPFGEGLSWGFDEKSGTLTIKGEGEMPNFDPDEETIYTAYPDFDIYEYFGVTPGASLPESEPVSASFTKSAKAFSALNTSEEGESEEPYFSPWKDLSGKIKSVVIEEGVITVGSYAFSFMFNLESVKLPSTLISIGEGAFYVDLKLKEINFPEDLKVIADAAFCGCGLEKLKIGKNIEYIGTSAFALSSVSSLEFEADVASMGEYVFESCFYIRSISIPADAENILSAIDGNLYFDLERVENKCSTYSFLENNFEALYFSSEKYKGYLAKSYMLSSIVPSIASILAYSIVDNYEDMTDEEFEATLEFIIVDVMCKLFGVKSAEEADILSEEARAELDENKIAGLSSLSVVCDESSKEHEIAKKYGINHKSFEGEESSNCFDFSGNISDTLSWRIDEDAKTLYIEGEGEISFEPDQKAPWLYFCNRYDVIDLSGCKITSICDEAFAYSKAKEIIFTSNPTISENAFSSFNSIETITLSKDAQEFDLSTLDSFTFKKLKVLNDNASLLGTVKSNGVTVYGGFSSTAKAYADENKLEFVYNKDNIEENLEDDFYLDWLTDYIKEYRGTSKIVRIPSEINGTKVRGIEAGAFDGTGVEYIILPEGIKNIGYESFKDLTTLKAIFFSSTVETISYNAFSGCTSLETVELSNKIEIIEACAFVNCESLKKITLPDTLLEIGGNAFGGCESLESINLPKSLFYIGDGAFSGCASLTDIDIPESVEEIGGGAFANCTSLKTAKLNNTAYGGTHIFEGSTALEEVTLTTGVHLVAPQVFLGVHNLKMKIENANAFISLDYTDYSGEDEPDIKIVEDDATIYGYTGSTAEDYAKKFNVSFVSLGTVDPISKESDFEYSENADSTLTITKYTGTSRNVEIPQVINGKQVTKIGTEVFADLSIEKVVIPEGVTEIMDSAFNNCEKIKELSLPNSLKIIGDAAFTDLYLIKELVIPENVESIGKFALAGFTTMTKLVIPESVKSIDDGAFIGSFMLEEVTIPKNVQRIGVDPFGMCYSLEKIYVAEDSPYYTSVDGILYSKDQSVLVLYPLGKKDKTHTVSNNVESISESAFKDNQTLEEVVIPDTVSEIGHGAFESCSNLTNVVIESGSASAISTYSLLRSRAARGTVVISDNAFKNCTSLELVTVPENVTYIGSSAFSGCNSLKKIVILNDECEIAQSSDNNECTIPANTIVHASKNSIAEVYANDNGLTFEEHKYEMEKVEKATCTKGEYTIYTCDGCKASYKEKTADANGHEIVIDKAVPATCTSTGLTEGEHCKNCDYEVEQTVTPKLNHEIVTDKAVPATCTSTGLTEGEHCKNCDYEVKQTVTPRLNHEIVIDKAVPATCTSTGLTEGEHCKNCDYRVEQTVTPKLNHEIVIDKAVPATCTSTGLTEGEHCKNCDYRVEQTVTPKLNHEIVTDKAVPATCTSTGLTEGEHCKNCDYRIEQRIVEPTGHIDANSDGKCASCGKNMEATACNHICHKTGFSAIIYRILLIFWKIFKINQYCQCGVAHY